MSLPLIAVTAGDPSGIGPEIAVKAARHPRVVDVCRPVIYGPHPPDELATFPAGQVSAASAARRTTRSFARPTTRARAACRRSSPRPSTKPRFAAAGLPWRGHTDLLAHLCGVPDVAMMFWSDRLRVVLATVHIPLAEVPRALTRERLLGTIRLTARVAAAVRRRRAAARPSPASIRTPARAGCSAREEDAT